MQDEDTNAFIVEQSEEDRARAEAEARRQKIMEEAGNRMDMVTGVTPRPTTTDEAVSTTEEAKAEAPSKSDKLAAMRRRRFKKKAASSKEDASKEDASGGETGTSTAAQGNNTTTTAKDSSNVTTSDEAASMGELQESSNEQTTEGFSKATEEDDGAPKKKYVGVAKMRRRMIKERQAKEEAEAAAKESSGMAQSASGIDVLSPQLAKRVTRKISVLPIIMHLVTVLLLFFAGLDIGLQQSRIQYSTPDLLVNKEITPIRRLEVLSRGCITEAFSLKSLETVVEEDRASYEDSPIANEFDEEFPQLEKQGDNIDPLFQVDLDKYTEGPGVFMMAGRFAVACHRVNLSIFYHFPLNLFQRLLATLSALVQSPPMLFLLALAIRQAIGKLVLGADLPVIEEEKQGKDVIGTVKNFAKSFVQKAFPTAVTFYDAWVHLRSDMYVILCGLFIGIAWYHQFNSFGSSAFYPYLDQAEQSATDGIADKGTSHKPPAKAASLTDEL
ncbi:hypothetical protein ACA910_022292 [Epithemia clementina (nom. ined.)]